MLADLFLLAAVFWAAVQRTEQAISVTRCDPAGYICEGRCPPIPGGVGLPPDDDPSGLCLKDPDTPACVCWLRNPSQERHLQTLFKCEVQNGTTVRHIMCLPPPTCFLPGSLGCLIILDCPCTPYGLPTHSGYRGWKSVIALILRSRTPVVPTNPTKEATPEKPSSDIREFSMKHLLFLLAFVIGPLLCWCLLTFFHEGKCRKKRPTPEAEPMPTERVEEEERPSDPALPQQPSTLSKCESPPPYPDPGEDYLLPEDCGPPPSYEDAIRNQWQVVVHTVQDADSE